MKFKIGDKVKVIKSDLTWLYWMSEMYTLVGQVHTIVGEWTPCGGETCSTLIVFGYNCGLIDSGRKVGEYAFPDSCLELAVKPGEQLEFDFMMD